MGTSEQGHAWPTRTLALLAILALVIAACGSGSATTAPSATQAATSAPTAAATQAASPEASPSSAATVSGPLEVWSWSPLTEKQVAIFEKAYPNVKVNLVNKGAGGAQYEAMQVAFAAGSGGPDVAMIEYPYIPQWALSGDLLALDDLGGSAVLGKFTDSVAKQLVINGKMYGTALNAAPMALGYRSDLYAKAGITSLPKTWAEFAADAEALKAANPGSFITNSPINDGIFLMMLWQAGATPITVDGNTIGINFNTDVTRSVLSYWVDLAKQGLVGTIPAWTPEWNQAFASGTLGGWLIPSWGNVILESNAADTAGKWRVATLPTADGTPASAEWGGGCYCVMAKSKNPEAAAAFVIFANTAPEEWAYTALEFGDFSPLKEVQANPELLNKPFKFFGDQPVNQVFADQMKVVPSSWQWSPFQSTLNQTVQDQILAAQDGTITVDQALENIDSKLKEYAQQQGFTVK